MQLVIRVAPERAADDHERGTRLQVFFAYDGSESANAAITAARTIRGGKVSDAPAGAS
jgi:hypothetical protein